MALANNLSTLFSITTLFPLVFLLNPAVSRCPKTFHCGSIQALEFPLAKEAECGLFLVDGCDSGENPKIRFDAGDRRYDLLHKHSTNRFSIRDPVLDWQLENRNCDAFENQPLPKSPPYASPYASFSISPNRTFVTCFNETFREDIQRLFGNYYKKTCPPGNVYYANQSIPIESAIPPGCVAVVLPVRLGQDPGRVFDLLTSEFTIEWNVSEVCQECHRRNEQCLTDNMNQVLCKRRGRNQTRLILPITLSVCGFVLLLCFSAACFIWQRKKRINKSYILSRSISYDPSSKSDIEGASYYFGIPIFSYTELEEATNNFDASKELGDGGFGTVYFGKLRDGREVAIKRLYEHNYKRVEQFMNEIKILTCLRHRNLVSLYGCTSRRSQELLLVYEYIPNGTVADHLHGEQAKEAPLTWPIRMSIAIETASALAYLHKSDIIHRDVKTNNILLDSNFCVKVADFGLSRLFPNDVTHISTAPQGTPGYVDPEYHQCYQLTDKSDVYSFGVVLIELISSMPAVDISRHRHEINLANLAVNRIQRCAFDELIDPSLGYETDDEIKRMTTTVAELAFRCLQLEKEMRPSMDEVVNFLGDIQSGVEGEKIKGAKPAHSPETDDTVLLKKKYYQSSPNAVTDVWVSGSSTTTSSIGG